MQMMEAKSPTPTAEPIYDALKTAIVAGDLA
jgi:DNA-binding GntR family transcriptional regulator